MNNKFIISGWKKINEVLFNLIWIKLNKLAKQQQQTKKVII